ncbi:arylesterase [Dechloromonas sp. ZS-1]|uniref:arylesterase n=1 Tax=Dechloromonas sp. ZS-1 TaxID=3138067 RepID=UPI0031FD041D
MRRIPLKLILSMLAILASLLPQPAHAAKTLLVFGDSLSAGYGLRPDEAWPALLDQRLKARKLDYSVANLSISGETTAGGRARLDAALKTHRPAVVILALGANDGLRGLPLAQMRANLEAMTASARQAGARVLIAGMRLPPNYGPYADEFQASFARVAQAQKSPLLPFLLEPVASEARFFLPDNLHPTADAQPRILDHVWGSLQPLLK